MTIFNIYGVIYTNVTDGLVPPSTDNLLQKNTFRQQRSSEEKHSWTSCDTINLQIKVLSVWQAFMDSNKLLTSYSDQGGNAPDLGWWQSSEEPQHWIWNHPGWIIAGDFPTSERRAWLQASSCSAWHVLGHHHRRRRHLPNPACLNPESQTRLIGSHFITPPHSSLLLPV